MALNTDLLALVTKIEAIDTTLVAADGFITKYPRLFSADARSEVTTARNALKAVVQELVAGTDLIVQLTLALK